MKSDENMINILGKYYREPGKIKNLWSDKESFFKVLSIALDVNVLAENKTTLHDYANYFISFSSFFFIESSSALEIILSGVGENKKKSFFMECFFSNLFISNDLIVSILNDEGFIRKMKNHGDWIEYPLTLRARKILMESNSGCVDSDDIIPSTLDIDDNLKEYLLSWAYEENKLSPQGINYFRDNFKKKYELLCTIINGG